MKPLPTLLLAAGRGRRLRPLTDRCPKPLLRVGGKTLLQHHLRALRRAGAERVVVNTCWLAEQFAQQPAAEFPSGLQVEWSQQDRLYGTAGDIRRALPLLQPNDAPVAVINADIYTDYPRQRLLQPQHPPDGSDCLAHMVLVPPPTGMKADCNLVNGRIQPADSGAEKHWVFSGMSLLHPRLFQHADAIPCELWRHVLLPAARLGKVSGEIWQGQWTDPGTHGRLHQLRTYLDRNGLNRNGLDSNRAP